MEDDEEMVQINDIRSLEIHMDLWQDNADSKDKPVGYI
jgi:membrane dipeptidase